jgi:hypothetical protein
VFVVIRYVSIHLEISATVVRSTPSQPLQRRGCRIVQHRSRMLPLAHPVSFERGRGKILFAGEMVIERALGYIRCLENVGQLGSAVPSFVHQPNARVDQMFTRRFCGHHLPECIALAV